MEGLSNFLSSIGQEVEDADEESFLLFSQDIPSSNLGFVDSKAATLDITIHNQDYAIHQSPTLLSSSRAGGTTGAVLWKITPLFAEWISNTSNSLWTNSILTPSSTVVELGCGISGLTALALSHRIGHYLATDQEYVHRLFRQNLDSNPPQSQRQQAPSKSKGRKQQQQQQQQQKSRSSKSTPTEQTNGHPHPNITFTSLDWELDNPATLRQQIPTTTSTATQERGEDDEEPAGSDKGFDVLLSCDCIYNESLIAPFVRTCAEICNLRPGARPTVCIIAQQQRSPDVFEAWLRETMRWFRVWRVGADALGGKLGGGSGYLVHMLVLRG
ncbi:S-adenosylmethionine-dependent methyltransferase [Aspergillus lucknowensis]|uniref:Diaminohydroxyphosphoribosylamino-pyrimidine deaminase n=1 Tax=Aspergillus lucknowensis TaxID=176173 RepID=A0ABR4M740_9EURO